MPRALLFPLTMLLLIATAIAMLASAMILPMSDAAEFQDPGSVALSAPGSTDVVKQFYAAVNETIATGNPAALRRVVNPSFADENPLPGVDPGRAGLEAYLATLHDANPGLQLAADIVISSADQVMTRVQVRPAAMPAAQPLGGSAQRTVWSPIEVFRIADDVIVGRWSHTTGMVLARPLAEQTLELPVPTPRVVSLMRITLAPGRRWDAPIVAGPRLLLLEAGVLEVQAVPEPVWEAAHNPRPGIMVSNAARVDGTQRVMLTAGQPWAAPAGAITSTTSAGSGEAHLLVVTFSEPRIPNGSHPEPEAGSLPSGVTAQVLAGDLATDLGTGSVSVILEQVALAPDASLNLWSTEGPLLLAVQAGQLETTTRGAAWVPRSRDGMSVASRANIQTTDNGMMLQPGGMVSLRNGEQHPASALVVRIRSQGAGRDP